MPGPRPQGGQQLLVQFFDQVEQQVLLAGKVVVERAGRQAQVGRQLAHADLAEALQGEELQRLVTTFFITRAVRRLSHRDIPRGQ
ncbi:hypothetical protein D3C87_1879170 [compost metagenome]